MSQSTEVRPTDPAATLSALYEADETAWLDRMAALAAERRVEDLDYENLSEFLLSMATRDRHEVFSRLSVLLKHLLKWNHQPQKRSRNWRSTIVTQRGRLRRRLASGTLRNYAESVLAEVYREAVKLAAIETGLDERQFPPACPWTLDQLLQDD